MARAGYVTVPITPPQRAAIASWLRRYNPPAASIVGGGRSGADHHEKLIRHFSKHGARVSATISRDDALWLGRILDVLAVGMLAPIPGHNTLGAMVACRSATSKRKGRPLLTVEQEEVAFCIAVAADTHESDRCRREKRLREKEWANEFFTCLEKSGKSIVGIASEDFTF